MPVIRTLKIIVTATTDTTYQALFECLLLVCLQFNSHSNTMADTTINTF